MGENEAGPEEKVLALDSDLAELERLKENVRHPSRPPPVVLLAILSEYPEKSQIEYDRSKTTAQQFRKIEADGDRRRGAEVT